MSRKIIPILFFSFLFIFSFFTAGTVTALAHGGEKTEFNALNNIKQSIVALDQRQPNMGVIDQKLGEVIDNANEVRGVDLEKVKEARALVMGGKYEEAKALLFAAIGEDPNGNDPKLGSPYLGYKKEFEGSIPLYLLLLSGVIFVIIGGLLINQSKRMV
ncbi:hypothetical protein [Thermicanus aegyptius]|uniref:hypothetical protein n=1 Tax=Thermicanus aegyptius TaxID=94009 RepID=UPI0004294A4C|nr:hypothetical protein [Thermicanus aegyptius]